MTHSPPAPSSSPLLPNPPTRAPSPETTTRLFPPLLPILSVLLLTLISTPPLLSSFPRLQLPILHPPHHRHHTHRLPTRYAIVAACHNRHAQLAQAAPTWLRTRSISQILVVDWSSEPPLRGVLGAALRDFNNASAAVAVQVVRVEGETDWVLTRAYNLAIRHVEVDYVFKVDCDYLVEEDALENHRLEEGGKGGGGDAFFTGYYMNARDANEIHLNGAMVVSQRAFWSVGGYDERIQRYGYDDEELYDRLTAVGVTRLNVSYHHLKHLQHGDEHRGQGSVKFARAQIDMNRLLLEKVGRKWSRGSRGSEYERVAGILGTVKAVYVPQALDQLVGVTEREEMWRLAVGRRLRDDYGVPWGLFAEMKTEEAEKLLGRLNARKVELAVDEVKERGLGVRFLVVHVQNGLGNRLRVLASGLAFGRRTKREVIVVWERDVHFGAFYRQIFNQTLTEFAVVDTWNLTWPLKGYGKYDSAWNDIEFYNYMEKQGNGKEVVDDKKKNIYFKSSSIMQSEGTSWELENDELKRLKVHGYITARASRAVHGGFDKVGGVHIRNRSLDTDIAGVEDNWSLYAKEDAEEIAKWRQVTTLASFAPEMNAMLRNGTVERFFVASDTLAVLQELKNIFGEEQVVFIERDCENRSGRCEQYAMADLLVLARTKILLGSTWSSFTEAAMRLGGPKALLAGTDFGPRPEEGKRRVRAAANGSKATHGDP